VEFGVAAFGAAAKTDGEEFGHGGYLGHLKESARGLYPHLTRAGDTTAAQAEQKFFGSFFQKRTSYF
jgi:hypothetical protein